MNRVSAITLFVENPRRSKAFYGDVFTAPVVYEDGVSAVVGFEGLLVNLLASSEAHELIAPAAVGAREAGSRFQLTITVEDADAAAAALQAKGVELLSGPVDRDWGVRTAAFADPDGHVWELAQDLA